MKAATSVPVSNASRGFSVAICAHESLVLHTRTGIKPNHSCAHRQRLMTVEEWPSTSPVPDDVMLRAYGPDKAKELAKVHN